ncbi:MAG TPA: TIGR03668 family PPOX class F420-dependent oxidoreductase [Candidatus Binataceae bacterium]|nr:TIGR03668 family PPOX class F420-dependent oxidoreductase [Candidatus Binataceae bacterium]HVB80108.1 TIGR03668 family PPOX class F420-dependent oxidoreductase [Candidatus Binataceae bacterium]
MATESESIALLNEPLVSDFLTGARLGHLATVDASGAPHNVPLCFWFDGARFYFVIDEKPKQRTGLELKRMRNIAADPRVALLIDHYEEAWSFLAYVLVHGRAQVVDDPNEYLLALRHLREKYPPYRQMALMAEANPMVRIEAERVHVWGERFKPHPGGEPA